MTDKQKIEIKIADKSHVEQISELEKICFPEAPWSRESVYEDIQINDRATYMVCMSGSRVVAYGGFWKILDEGHITNIAVAPEFRQLGIGGFLVDNILKKGKADGIGVWTLEVRESNASAIRLYEKFGFEKIGLFKKYFKV